MAVTKVFIKASINDTTIYIKVDSGIIHALFDFMVDRGYVVDKSTPEEWDAYLMDCAYEIDTKLELTIFQKKNEKKRRNGYRRFSTINNRQIKRDS